MMADQEAGAGPSGVQNPRGVTLGNVKTESFACDSVNIKQEAGPSNVQEIPGEELSDVKTESREYESDIDIKQEEDEEEFPGEAICEGHTESSECESDTDTEEDSEDPCSDGSSYSDLFLNNSTNSENDALYSDSSDSEDDDSDEAPEGASPALQVSKKPLPDYTWVPDQPVINTIPFTKQRKLLVLPEGPRPIDFFNLLVDENFYNLVKTETNNYARQILTTPGIPEKLHISRWQDVTVAELRIFFGLVLKMGIINIDRLSDYWSKNTFFNFPIFRANMSRERFLLIFKCLHFAKNPEAGQPAPEDRFYKIRPLMDYFNNKMEEIYYPDKNLCLDDAMVLWRGRLLFPEYIKNIRDKYGIKVYMLTEPDGTIINFSLYTGALDSSGKGHATNVALDLMRKKLNVGHSLYTDSFYSSVELATRLLEEKTYLTGILRLKRKYTPADIKAAKLKKGEGIARSSSGILVGRWRDKLGEIVYLTTEFENKMESYRTKRGEDEEKPQAIVNNYKNMYDIDRQDQMLSSYPCEKIPFRWYKKIGIHVLYMLLINSYLLYRKYGQNKRRPLYKFQDEVIKYILPSTSRQLNPQQPAVNHFLEKTPEGGKWKRVYRKCALCTSKKIRRETRYYCQSCPGQPALCVKCFPEYHTN